MKNVFNVSRVFLKSPELSDISCQIQVDFAYKIPRAGIDSILDELKKKLEIHFGFKDDSEGGLATRYTTLSNDDGILYIESVYIVIWTTSATTYNQLKEAVQKTREFFEQVSEWHRFLYELVKVNDEKEVQND